METDIELLKSARMLNGEALIEIFDLYSASLYNYALRLSGDPVTADQIVGDVFAILLDQFSRGDGPTANLRSYLFQAVYHRLIDQVRSARHAAPLEVVDWRQPDVNAAHIGLENHVLFKQTLQAIQKYLTKDQRHVIILRFLEGISLQETAAITGKTVSHVKVIQNRAIAALRRAGLSVRP